MRKMALAKAVFRRGAWGLLALLGAAPLAADVNPPGKTGAIDPRLGAPFEQRERPRLGSDKAPIVVVEFGSYKCAHCETFHQRIFPALHEQYIKTGQVQWFMVPTSDNAADASGRIFTIGRCVDRQGKFWETLDFLMTISNKPASFLNDLVAKNSTIDAGELAFCLQSRESRLLVTKDFEEYRLLKVLGTPTFVIRKLQADGSRTETVVRGYQPVEYFQRIFDELVKTP